MNEYLFGSFKEVLAKKLGDLATEVATVNLTTDHDLFLDFCGHVLNFRLTGYLNGWSKEKDVDIRFDMYYDDTRLLEHNGRHLCEIQYDILSKVDKAIQAVKDFGKGEVNINELY